MSVRLFYSQVDHGSSVFRTGESSHGTNGHRIAAARAFLPIKTDTLISIAPGKKEGKSC